MSRRRRRPQPWTAATASYRKRTVTYADAGVSIHAGEQAVELLKTKVHRTWRPEVVGDLGGFAGLFRLDIKKYKNPILASSTDGVGTKLVIAQQMDIHDTVGIDLVAMVVDDLVACGAEPLFLLDYIACGEVVPEQGRRDRRRHRRRLPDRRLRAARRRDRRAPGRDAPRTSTTSPAPASAWSRRTRSSAATGSRSATSSSRCARPACTPTATRWSATCCSAPAGCGWTRVVEDFGNQRTLGEELLTPTRIYAKDCLDLIAEADVRALRPRHRRRHPRQPGPGAARARRRGRGPRRPGARSRSSTWCSARAASTTSEMESTFNMGVGMLAVVVARRRRPRAGVPAPAAGIDAWAVGEIIEGTGEVQMVGSHTRG